MVLIVILGIVLATLWARTWKGWKQPPSGEQALTWSGAPSGADSGVFRAGMWGCFATVFMLPATILWVVALVFALASIR